MIRNTYDMSELQCPTLKHIHMNFAINDLVPGFATNEIKCCDTFIWKLFKSEFWKVVVVIHRNLFGLIFQSKTHTADMFAHVNFNLRNM